MQKDVSIIIVNYNTAQMTLDCLNSVYDKTKDINFEVFVVDNASKDDSIERIEKKFPEVRLIKNAENIGFGRANNLAIRQSEAKYVFLLNSDTILINNAVKILYDFMENTSNAGACGGNLYAKDDNHTISYFNAPTLKGKFISTFKLYPFYPKETKKLREKGHNEKDEQKEVEVISGADLMIRKSVLDEVKDFDNDFFLYFEETELQYRIHKAGYKIFIVPKSKIYHLEGATTCKNRKARRYEFLRGEYLYFKKTCPKCNLALIKLLCIVSHITKFFTRPTMILKLWNYILKN